MTSPAAPSSTSPPTAQPRGQLNFFLRALWYLLIGWWITGLALTLGYLAGLTIVGLPLAFWIFNRAGLLLTLRRRTEVLATETGDEGMVVQAQRVPQRPLWLRAVYFVLIGWWAALLWMLLSYVVSLTIIGIPVGIMMLNRLPAVYTLQRN